MFDNYAPVNPSPQRCQIICPSLVLVIVIVLVIVQESSE